MGRSVGRNELRKALNEMDGAHLHQRQANGWPRFPLSVLEDPANLLRLVAVLDRIATDSYTVPATEGVRSVEDSEPEHPAALVERAEHGVVPARAR